MNFQKFSSSLLNCFIAAMLLLSLWVSGAQDLWTQDALGNSDMVLTLDADAHADDSFEQVALISGALPAISILHNPGYPQRRSQPVLPNCFQPPDRPPAEFA